MPSTRATGSESVETPGWGVSRSLPPAGSGPASPPSPACGGGSGWGPGWRSRRRAFLKLLALAGAGLAACGLRPDRAGSTAPAPAPAPAPTLAPPPPAEAGRVIPVDKLYVQSYQHTLEPVSREAWRLLVGGQVRAAHTLTWADLQSLTLVEQMHTMECIGNPVGGRLIGNLVWQGVRLRDVLALAEPSAGSDHLLMSAADEYFTCVPLDLALDERSLIAFSVGGQPLPNTHGFPARVLLPGVYGQKQPKWITALEAVTGPRPGTWERQGWSDSAAVQVNSRIDYPPDGSQVPAGQPLPVSGVAFADTSGVARVEVSVDGGLTWSEAELFPGPSTMTWTVWQWPWAAPAPGPRLLKVRATSGAGQTQVDAGGFLSGVFPDGTTSIHSITVTVA